MTSKTALFYYFNRNPQRRTGVGSQKWHSHGSGQGPMPCRPAPSVLPFPVPQGILTHRKAWVAPLGLGVAGI
jgi:hypothetical protein